MSREKQTLEFYDRNSDQFVSGTLNADMRETRSRFTACLPPGALILDLGCGSGRDTKAFLELGYRVEACDGSEELCARAAGLAGIPVRHMLFQELDGREKYDGVWACASILHLPGNELADVLGRIEMALKPDGVLYASFKYGSFEGMRGGRYFTDFTEDSLKAFWTRASAMRIFDLWVTQDVRPDRKYEKWINLLAARV